MSFDAVMDLGSWVLRKVGPDAFGRQTKVHLQSIRMEPTGKLTADWYTLLVSPGETRDSASITEGLSGRASSTDGGLNWWVQPNAGPFPGTMPGTVEGIPPPKMEHYYRMTPAGLGRSPDRGTHWEPLVLKPTLSSVRAMAIHPSGRASYALAETGLFRQDPDSRLWVALLPPLRTMHDTVGPPVPGVVGPHPEAYGPPKRPAEEMILGNPLAIWVDLEDPNHLYFCCGADGLFEVFISGERFQARKLWEGPCGDLYQDPIEPRFLYSGGIGQGTLCWSHDKGRSWKVVEQVPPGKVRFAASRVPGRPVWALVFDAERPTALLGAWASPDHGGSWKEVAQQGPFAHEELLDVTYCDGRAWAVARERWKPRLLFSDNGGSRWENVPVKTVSAYNRHTRIFCDPIYGLIGVGMEPRVVSLRASKKFADVVVASRTGRSWGSISNGLPLKGKVIDFATSQASLFMLLGDPNGENAILWEYK
ncbi:MAG: hypothetical protein FJX76_27505 [Armatimonadetes bacterium]|nr:hypothetical protein [Armatimonadota bacterium]